MTVAQRYPTIASLPNQEAREAALRVRGFLLELDRIYALPPSQLESLKKEINAGNYATAMQQMTAWGFKFTSDSIQSVAGITSSSVDASGANRVAADALAGATGRTGAIIGGIWSTGSVAPRFLSSVVNDVSSLLTRDGGQRARFTERQAEQLAAAYAGSLYEHTANFQPKPLSVGLQSGEFLTYAQAFVTSIMERFLPKMLGGSDTPRSVEDILRDWNRDAAMTLVRKDLVDSGLASSVLAEAMTAGNAQTRTRDGRVLRTGAADNANPTVLRTEDQRVMGQTRDAVAAGVGALGTVVANTSGMIADRAVSGVVDIANGHVVSGVGDLAIAGAGGTAAALATAKAAQIGGTGFRIPFTNRHVPGVGQITTFFTATAFELPAQIAQKTGMFFDRVGAARIESAFNRVVEQGAKEAVQAARATGASAPELAQVRATAREALQMSLRPDLEARLAQQTPSALTRLGTRGIDAVKGVEFGAYDRLATMREASVIRRPIGAMIDGAVTMGSGARTGVSDVVGRMFSSPAATAEFAGAAARVQPVQSYGPWSSAAQTTARVATPVAAPAAPAAVASSGVPRVPLTPQVPVNDVVARVVTSVPAGPASAIPKAVTPVAVATAPVAAAPVSVSPSAAPRVVAGAGVIAVAPVISGGITLLQGGSAEDAAKNAALALPVVNTGAAIAQGRTAEALIRGFTDAGTVATAWTAPAATTGAGAVLPAAIGIGTLAVNEVARPIARAFGADVDPSMIEMTVRGIGRQMDEAKAGRTIIDALRANPNAAVAENADPTLKELVATQREAAQLNARAQELNARRATLTRPERAELQRIAVQSHGAMTMENGLAQRFVQEQITAATARGIATTPADIAAAVVVGVNPVRAAQAQISGVAAPDTISGGVAVDGADGNRRPNAPMVPRSTGLGAVVLQ